MWGVFLSEKFLKMLKDYNDVVFIIKNHEWKKHMNIKI